MNPGPVWYSSFVQLVYSGFTVGYSEDTVDVRQCQILGISVDDDFSSVCYWHIFMIASCIKLLFF